MGGAPAGVVELRLENVGFAGVANKLGAGALLAWVLPRVELPKILLALLPALVPNIPPG